MKPEPGPRISIADTLSRGRCSMAGRSSDTTVLEGSIPSAPMKHRWQAYTPLHTYGRSVIGNTPASKPGIAGSNPVAYDRETR